MSTEVRSTESLLSDCVHCGFCLPACPTYASWGLEMDSPRGRIDLMNGIETGAIELTDKVVGHFDACLGCMACVTACPSGVQYDQLIERTRAKIETTYPRKPADRALRELVFALFPYPNRLRLLSFPLFAMAASGLQALVRKSGLLDRLPPGLAQLEALSPNLEARDLGRTLARVNPAEGIRRGRVAMIAGCVQRVFFPGVNDATIRVLTAEGFEVIVPEHQGCCGALSLHSGREDEAKGFARALIDRIDADRFDAIVINAAGCGSSLKEYGMHLADDPLYRERAAAFSAKVRDVNEFLAAVEPRARRHPIPMRVAYHDACHLAHAQKIREQPRMLLRSIPELELLEIPSGDQCCGSAGVYNIFEPESAREIGDRKVTNVLSTQPDLLASANPGCTLQIQSILRERGLSLSAAHPIEILAASIDGVAPRTVPA